jgi:hypothetical protein
MLDNLAYFDALVNHTTPSGGVTGLVVKCGIGTSRTDHLLTPKTRNEVCEARCHVILVVFSDLSDRMSPALQTSDQRSLLFLVVPGGLFSSSHASFSLDR